MDIEIEIESRPPGADWVAWLPGTYHVGQLARRSSGPPRQMLKEGVGQRRGPSGPQLEREGFPVSSDKLFAGHEFLVTPLLMGPVCIISQKIEEPVCSCPRQPCIVQN